MTCLYCRKEIGPLRRLRDKSYCCDSHRKKLASHSARALREAEDLYGYDDSPAPKWGARHHKLDEKPAARPGYATTVFASMAVVFLLIALSTLRNGNSSTAAKGISTLPDAGPRSSGGGVGQMLGNLLQNKGSGTLREDFQSGSGNWEGLKSVSSNWTSENGQVRPTGLRLWKPSTQLSNYELEFMGQIEHKSIDWAFRASDLRNYYATKLIISKPGPLPNAGLIRFIVLDGRERERVELPLPLTLEKGVDYRVRVSVRGDRFLTSVNGQLVSSWTDNRLSRGGVGFFSEDGESALVKWVSLSERDSLLGRLIAQFSILTFPAPPLR